MHAMWNPVDPGVVENPHPFWAWLRREAPVHRLPDAGYYLVSRYEDILRVSRDSETYSSELRAIVQRDEAGRARLLQTQLVGQPQARVLGVADGDVHASHRRVVGRTFSPSRMERMSQLAFEIAQRCVARFTGASRVDVVESLAIPLPLELTTRLLGLPLEDQAQLQAWTDHALRMSGGLASPKELAEDMEQTTLFNGYLGRRFDEALERPGDDVIGDLARAVRDAERGEAGLERWEAVAILFQLVVGGIETTVGLIAAAIHHATQQPAFWSRLRDETEVVTAFVEESIRLDGPAIGNLRRSTRDTELGGIALPEGSTVVLLWGSANRDESQFPRAESFVLDRPNIKTHLGFGLGKHFCLGAALARMETRVALQALRASADRLLLDCDPAELRHKPSMGIRRLQSLPVRLRA
jgi:cytochrome P450